MMEKSGNMKKNCHDYHPSINELISLRQASTYCGLTTSHFRRLLGKGKLWGIKIDSIWLITEYAIPFESRISNVES